MTASTLPSLSHEELRRYSRHLMLPDVALDGQRRLKAARVLVIGAGGLGSPVALYLAAAGVGTLGLVDFDVVDASNLQRQILHGTRDIGRSKLASAQERIADVNPNVRVDLHPVQLDSSNALEIIREYDIVIDGTDNFPTRYLTNDACVILGKPSIYGSIFRFEGQVSVFGTTDGPCYRCLYPEPPPPGLVPSCAEGGVLGVLPGLIGTMQATEAIKLIVGIGDPLVGRLLLVDSLGATYRTLKVRRDPWCPACGTHEIRELIDYEQFCGVGSAPAANTVPYISATELAERLRRGDDVDVIDVREEYEWEIAHIEGTRLLPFADVPAALATLDSARDIVALCKNGARSAAAISHLQTVGFRRVWNLRGGIDAWSRDVDPGVPTY